MTPVQVEDHEMASILVLPLYLLAIVLSDDISRLVSQLPGIDSQGGIALMIVIALGTFLWMFRTLIRPDVERAFSSFHA